MCDPISIAAAVATTAGGIINSRQQQKAAEAQIEQQNMAEEMAQSAREAERKRQTQIDEDNYAQLRRTIDEIAPTKRTEQAQTQAAAPDNRVQAAASRIPTPELPQGEAGEVIADAPELAEDEARTKRMIDALALLTAQGSTQSAAGDRFGRFGSILSNNISKGRRSLSVADFEQRVPVPGVTANQSPVGDILQVLGSAGSAYAGGGADPFADWSIFGRRPMTPPPLGRGPS